MRIYCSSGTLFASVWFVVWTHTRYYVLYYDSALALEKVNGKLGDQTTTITILTVCRR